MAISATLDRELTRMRTRFAKSPVPRFFAWWGSELLGCLPASWREILVERSEPLLIETVGRELVLWRPIHHQLSEFARISLDMPVEEQRLAFEKQRSRIDDPNLRLTYCISPVHALCRSLTLPAAAQDNLRQVLSFEMDRQTPFKADQVYFDAQPELEEKGRQIHVELLVIPRKYLDDEITPLTASGIQIDSVDCWTDATKTTRMGMNLLPPERRARRKNRRLRVNLALAFSVLILLYVVMMQALTNTQAALATMTEEVEKTKKEAKAITELRKTLADSIKAANFLSTKKYESPTMVTMLNELTKHLPDETFVERLNVDDKGKIELQGQSTEAAKLVDELKKSPLLSNPGFQGAIQPDATTKKERFTLTLELKKPTEQENKSDSGDKNKTAITRGGANALASSRP